MAITTAMACRREQAMAAQLGLCAAMACRTQAEPLFISTSDEQGDPVLRRLK
jgi:hypothetical protein